MKNLTIPTNFFQDERIIAIAGEFGTAAQLVVVQLLCEISAAGYFIEWNTLKQNFYARKFALPTSELRAIVNRLAEYGYFSKEMLEQDHVLTNEDCQKRYFRPRTRRRVITGIPHLIITLVQWIPDEQPKTHAQAQAQSSAASAQAQATNESAIPAGLSKGDMVAHTGLTAPNHALHTQTTASNQHLTAQTTAARDDLSAANMPNPNYKKATPGCETGTRAESDRAFI